MYRGSHPRVRKHTCSLCATKKPLPPQKPTPEEPPTKTVKLSKQEKASKPKAPRSKQQLKRAYADVFVDQEGGRVQLIAPVRAAVEQAKAMLSRRRRCRKGKGCKLRGGRRRAYNPKSVKRISHKPKRRRNGRK